MSSVKEAAAAPVDLSLLPPDRDIAETLHDQVAAQIRRAIADGEAAPGDRLPKAVDLAAVLGVNTNTVLRALRILQDEGILELRRRRGITVAAIPSQGNLHEQAQQLVREARRLGCTDKELLRIVREELSVA